MMTPEEHQEQVAKWARIEQFTFIYLGMIWVASSLAFVGFFALLQNPFWAIAPSMIFGNVMPSWYANFPSKRQVYDDATDGVPCDLSCLDIIIHNVGFWIAVWVVIPIIVAAYERGYHLTHSHFVLSRWFVVAPLLLVLIFQIAYHRDKRRDTSEQSA